MSDPATGTRTVAATHTTGLIRRMPKSSPAIFSKHWRELDPPNSAVYEANRAAFLDRLGDKLNEWESKLAPVRAVPMVAYHNSWPYFARRFRLEFVGFIEVKPGVPPAPSHLARIIATMKARGVRIVIREPHEPERDVAFVAARAGASVVILGASVGALLRASDYISMFDANVEALASAAATR